ncbi:hypothetical protein KY289_001122 [Solanum tuberosum]|nr:hypothetical protein KY289_001122 [Solanum tuberosum]
MEGDEANDTLEGGKVVYQVAKAKMVDSSCDIKPSDIVYTSLREENRVSNFGTYELNSENNIISLTGASRESQKSETKENDIYQGSASHGFSQNQMFQSYEELPLKVKGILRLDRLGLPNLRTTNKKKAEITYDPP